MTIQGTSPMMRITVIPMPAYAQLLQGQLPQQSTSSDSSNSGGLGTEVDALTKNRKDLMSAATCDQWLEGAITARIGKDRK